MKTATTRELRKALADLLVAYHCHKPGNPYCVAEVQRANELLTGSKFDGPAEVSAEVYRRKHAPEMSHAEALAHLTEPKPCKA